MIYSKIFILLLSICRDQTRVAVAVAVAVAAAVGVAVSSGISHLQGGWLRLLAGWVPHTERDRLQLQLLLLFLLLLSVLLIVVSLISVYANWLTVIFC